jgi:hypothetical protein
MIELDVEGRQVVQGQIAEVHDGRAELVFRLEHDRPGHLRPDCMALRMVGVHDVLAEAAARPDRDVGSP